MVRTVLACECGFEASAEDERRLVAEIRRHAREAHGMALSHGEALQLASHAAQEGPGRNPCPEVGNRQKEER